ncbi:MAG: asparagine synthase-related protein, partial [Usitatibacter sp.]
MSGICGIVHLDGAPADRASIRSMTDFLAYRGPDAQEIWIEGCAALGHAMLRTTPEDDRARLPCSLDGSAWITADARIDGQEDLKEKLRAAGRGRVDEASGAELVLHAYHAWGEDCPKYLIGDFAFAIWDAPRRRLFFARDHFGVKPFFYARVGECVVFSNTLECVRSHPAISGVLDDLAIADFLLFDASQDAESTVFADIRRLPPAHCLTFSPGAQRSRPACYWTFPPAEVRHRPAGDYVQRFRELLEIAIADRLRTRRVGLSMSGGLDSTSIAAVAKGLLARGEQPFELKAFTVVFDRIIPDEERHFAGLAAQWIGIPIHYCAGDDYRLYEGFGAAKTPHPEPVHEPEGGVFGEFLKAQVAHARVALTGWDGDALLNESPKPYIRALLKERRYGRMMGALVGYAISERRVVPLAWRR